MPKVLIIEDDKFLLKLYSEKLQREGYSVIGATTGEEGLEKTLAEKPDLIILDLILPRKSGFEVLKEIKANPQIKDIPIVILSILGQKSDIKKGLELGANAYLAKPDFFINKLSEVVKEHLTKNKKR